LVIKTNIFHWTLISVHIIVGSVFSTPGNIDVQDDVQDDDDRMFRQNELVQCRSKCCSCAFKYNLKKRSSTRLKEQPATSLHSFPVRCGVTQTAANPV